MQERFLLGIWAPVGSKWRDLAESISKGILKNVVTVYQPQRRVSQCETDFRTLWNKAERESCCVLKVKYVCLFYVSLFSEQWNTEDRCEITFSVERSHFFWNGYVYLIPSNAVYEWNVGMKIWSLMYKRLLLTLDIYTRRGSGVILTHVFMHCLNFFNSIWTLLQRFP